ncbi:hypothetical protein BLNAU_6351 [Blattamonas nauphoetae]|uniref:Uncharacterized protein n=1 Tax=Blattamonas nauphoetae TaxID=2049346 RepID=A0ABQ9Y4A8_9EUKA|nr:hypothetical protein BLNAU_6351 [Blattamonas nauphoetae]
MPPQQRNDRDAMNIIQRALQISNADGQSSKMYLPENKLDLTDTALTTSFAKIVFLHLVPGFMIFLGYNLLINIFPSKHLFTLYYAACLFFAVPVELLIIMHYSKKITGFYVPPHWSSIFLYWPPEIKATQTDKRNTSRQEQDSTKGKKKDEESSLSLGNRLKTLLIEFLHFLRIEKPLTILSNFIWIFVAVTLTGPFESSVYYHLNVWLKKKLVNVEFPEFLKHIHVLPRSFGRLTYTNLGGWKGLTVIIAALVIVCVVEELYYRGLLLPSLVLSRERSLKEKEQKKAAGKRKKDEDETGEKDAPAEEEKPSKKTKKSKDKTPASQPSKPKKADLVDKRPFSVRNAWLLNAILSSLSLVYVSPWITVTRFIHLSIPLWSVVEGKNMSYLLFPQILMAGVELIHLLQNLRQSNDL